MVLFFDAYHKNAKRKTGRRYHKYWVKIYPPLAESFLVLIILAAYSCPVVIFIHLLTTENAPLETKKQTKCQPSCNSRCHRRREACNGRQREVRCRSILILFTRALNSGQKRECKPKRSSAGRPGGTSSPAPARHTRRGQRGSGPVPPAPVTPTWRSGPENRRPRLRVASRPAAGGRRAPPRAPAVSGAREPPTAAGHRPTPQPHPLQREQ